MCLFTIHLYKRRSLNISLHSEFRKQ